MVIIIIKYCPSFKVIFRIKQIKRLSEPLFYEITVTGNLSLRAKLLIGGMDNVFKKIFNNVKEGERLLKASHCCLYTTEGSITGLLFISTDKLAFCSDRSVVKLFSQTGESLRFRYKVYF